MDEKLNPEELKFYYKGRAYDSPYELQDRLQQLYKEGMERFLSEDITYIDNQAIDNAFRVFKDKPNATKDVIKGYFKQLKFFTNNDFAFIDVHNEKLFHQNFDVLLKILKLFQDIKLTGSEENQFLGDMFEGFLDQGVKQSEGQFFTPMPIVKFIVNSLPKKEKAKVIDYACGAGHFLNEYASVNEDSEIVGIEKEYRLSKVAKVSSFMYSQEIDIIYSDALAKNKNLQNNSFDTLIANPPYSVKGFLETLSKQERENFQLINAIDEKSYTANNAIECFFIERAVQLLKSGGDAGIIVPSSILSKGSHKINAKSKNVYVQTRELILKFFHLVAIAEFGSGTFGKTGTNTVTLFLKRREQQPDNAEHFKNMVNTWFSGDFSTNQAFQDEGLLESYLNHISLQLADYKDFLKGEINETLQKTDLFQDYLTSFNALSETKNRKKQRTYKQKTADQKQAIETAAFLSYAKAIEKDKCYYFALADTNESEVIIVKSPSDNKLNKKFLGYEWSGRKGDEGIKYIPSQTAEIEELELEEEDKRVLENLQNLANINTPLYNPKDRLDNSKINTLIAKNFAGEAVEIPQVLSEFVTKAKLIDMLDFSRLEFDKSISLSPKKNIEVIGKQEWQIKLGDIAKVIAGQSPKSENYNENKNGLAFFQGKKDFGELYLNEPVVWTSQITKESIKDDLVMSVRAPVGAVNINPFDKICIGRGIAAIRSNNIQTQKYLYELASTFPILFQGNTGAIFDSISTDDLRATKIPFPPLDIQEKIVNACEVVNLEVQKAKESIKKFQADIEKEINTVNGEMVKLQDITSKIGSGATPRGGESSYKPTGISLIRSQNIYDDVLFNITGASVARCCVVESKYLPARVNQHVAIIRAAERILPKFLQLILTSKKYKTDLIEIASKSSTREAITKIQLESYKVPLPDISVQKIFIHKIELLETKIIQAQTTKDKAPNKKEAILKKFL